MTTRTKVVVSAAVFVVAASVGPVSSAAGGATATVPGAPTITGFTPGPHRATIAFTAPASDDGAPISQYLARFAPNPDRLGYSRTSPIVVEGLYRGLAYSCTVTARNRVGVGPPSAPIALSIGGTSCMDASGTVTFTPPLPKLGSNVLVEDVMTFRGPVSRCSGASGVTSATLDAVTAPSNRSNCTTFATYRPTPTLGTLTVTWNTQTTSTIALTLHQVKHEPNLALLAGAVTAGLFKGLHATLDIRYEPPKKGCTTTALSTLPFAQLFPIGFSIT